MSHEPPIWEESFREAEVFAKEEESNGLVLPAPFMLSRHVLSINGRQPSLEECGEALKRLSSISATIKYWRGDLIVLTEGLYTEAASQLIDAELLDEAEASAERFVAHNVPPEMRALAPSWDHARVVANLKPAEQKKWLQQALDQDWIASKLKHEVLAAANGGETAVRYLLLVDAKTEAKQKELAKDLEARGYTCTPRTSVRKQRKKKAPKAKRGKKEVTAKKRRGAPKMYTRRRPPV